MRRTLPGAFAVIAVLAAVSSLFGQTAQSNPMVGTWKLNLAMSKYDPPNLAPKSQTVKYESVANGLKVSVEGIDGNGSRMAYGYTANYDGKDYPETGVGIPNGADTIAALKRIDAYTIESTGKRAGKVVQTTRRVVSKDGKMLTITAKGTNQSGQPTNTVTMYEKQ